MKSLKYLLHRVIKLSTTKKTTLLMGAKYEPQQFGQPVERTQSLPKRTSDFVKHFRPSCFPIKNTLIKNYQFFSPYYDKTHEEIKLPVTLLCTSDETLLNYFSIL